MEMFHQDITLAKLAHSRRKLLAGTGTKAAQILPLSNSKFLLNDFLKGHSIEGRGTVKVVNDMVDYGLTFQQSTRQFKKGFKVSSEITRQM